MWDDFEYGRSFEGFAFFESEAGELGFRDGNDACLSDGGAEALGEERLDDILLDLLGEAAFLTTLSRTLPARKPGILAYFLYSRRTRAKALSTSSTGASILTSRTQSGFRTGPCWWPLWSWPAWSWPAWSWPS